MTAVLFIVAAGAGAGTRFAASQRMTAAYATLLVNVAGAFLLGVFAAAWPNGDALTVLGTGFCGALTTFSTLALELSERSRAARLSLGAAHVIIGVAAAAAGFSVG